MAVPSNRREPPRKLVLMNPLVLSDADYKAVFERITQLSLEYVASVNERPTFPKITGSEAEALFAKPLPE